VTNGILSVETLHLCRNLLAGQTLNVGADDFVPVAAAVGTALGELDSAIREATTEPWPDGAPALA